MSEEPESINMTVGTVTARLTVRCASVGDGMRRGLLAGQVSREPLTDQADQTVAIVIYPRCVAVTDGVIIIGDDEVPAKQITPAQFVALPEQIGDAWFQEVVRKNPHWDIAGDKDTEDAEKKD